MAFAANDTIYGYTFLPEEEFKHQAPKSTTLDPFKTKDGWKAYDVIIEGISYVMSYRTQFGTQIEQQGIDAVIKKLQSDAAKPKPANDKQG